MSDEQQFKKRADTALALLSRELAGAADDYGFESKFSGGAITVEGGHPRTKLVISANMASQQILVSAPGKSYKLDWDIVENSFVHTESGENMKELIEQALSRQLKQDVTL